MSKSEKAADQPAEKSVAEELIEAVRLCRSISRELDRAGAAALAAGGISQGQREVLDLLADAGEATAPEVTRRLGLKRQFVQQVLAESLKGGLVKTRTNPDHARSSFFSLSKDGKGAVNKVHAEQLKWARALSATLPAQAVHGYSKVQSAVAASLLADASA